MGVKKNKARLQILNSICNFSLKMTFDDMTIPGGGMIDYAFVSDIGGRDIRPGDLVAIGSARFSKWYLSWVNRVEITEDRFSDVFTLESIEDGEECDWHNVSLSRMNRKTVREHPEWRWTDEQHVFNSAWRRLDGGYYRPIQVEFGEKEEVTLTIRASWSTPEEPRASYILKNWKQAKDDRLKKIFNKLEKEMKSMKAPMPKS